jgi:hypothetical protein
MIELCFTLSGNRPNFSAFLSLYRNTPASGKKTATSIIEKAPNAHLENLLAGICWQVKTAALVGRHGFYITQEERVKGGDKHDRCAFINLPKIEIVVEFFGNFWTGKCSRNKRCIIDAQHYPSIFEGSHVGNNDRDNILNTQMANPVESVARGVGLDILASYLHN